MDIAPENILQSTILRIWKEKQIYCQSAWIHNKLQDLYLCWKFYGNCKSQVAENTDLWNKSTFQGKSFY